MNFDNVKRLGFCIMGYVPMIHYFLAFQYLAVIFQ